MNAHPDVTWRVKHWARTTPRVGRWVVAGLPLVFLLPLDAAFGTALAGARAILTIAALGAAGLLGRGTALPRPSFVWLYQKGLSIPDFVLKTWLVDLTLGSAILVWWVGGWAVIAGARGDAALSDVVAVLGTAAAVFAVMHAFLFPIGAAGSTRGVDVAVLLVLVSLLQPLLFGGSGGGGVARVAHWVIPPFLDAVRLGPALAAGNWPGALDGALHLLLFAAVCIAIGNGLLARWRPAR